MLTKEDVIKAFENNNRKRLLLLYDYYKEELFDKNYPAKFIADKINEDLGKYGINVNEQIIYNINFRVIKGKNKAVIRAPSSSILPSNLPDHVPEQLPPKEESPKPPLGKNAPLILGGVEHKDASEEKGKKHINPFKGKI